MKELISKCDVVLGFEQSARSLEEEALEAREVEDGEVLENEEERKTKRWAGGKGNLADRCLEKSPPVYSSQYGPFRQTIAHGG